MITVFNRHGARSPSAPSLLELLAEERAYRARCGDDGSVCLLERCDELGIPCDSSGWPIVAGGPRNADVALRAACREIEERDDLDPFETALAQVLACEPGCRCGECS